MAIDTSAEKIGETIVPTEQTPLVMYGYTWEQYLSIEELLRENGIRVRYLNGWLEIEAPVSETHEHRKSHLGCLIEAWCLENEIRFTIQGNTTLFRKPRGGGEPDESYCFHQHKDTPDLAIEVALTSGGLSKRKFYREFQVPELWIWRKDRLEIHVFDEPTGEYQPAAESSVLPGIDLALVEECARIEYASDAIREFKARMK